MSADRIARRAELLLADARAAYAAGDRAGAHALATAVLALDPGNAGAGELLDGSDQRCQMTLMFCDLVGSTALADRIDPEELSAVLRDYRAACADAIARYGGFIEDRKGDGLLVRFGYPWVHEDDARRAVLSGLDIVRAIAALPRDLHLRIAIHTGLVVIDGGEVVGAAPNEAARMQALAEPDTVVISDATYALVRDHFDVVPRGEAALRGVSRPFELFDVAGERTDAPLERAGSRTPFADREAERALVAELWSATCAGNGALAAALLVTAPPGMGKSRLVREAARQLGAPVLACRCSSYHQTTSLHPFKRLLETICSIGEQDAAHERLAKLRARLQAGGAGGDLPALAAALSIPAAAIAPPADMDPTKLRAMALHAAAQLVRSATHAAPAILFVDDLHWADESTLELIAMLLAEPSPKLLIVLTARHGFSAPWPHDMVRRLELGGLAAADLAQIARGMAEGAALDERHRLALVARSDGVPLFLEELVRSGAALGGDAEHDGALEPSASRVPAALRDPLLARLVHPGVDLALAQTAATIGRDVERTLLQRACAMDDKQFQAKLANLATAGLVDPARAGAIRFRHELIRQVAYETQLRSVRRERHSRIADLLREGTTRGPADAGELAFHLEHAQRTPEAIEAHMDAARVHQSLGAHKEAMSTLTHVLDLVGGLPTGAARLLGELTARQLRSFSAVMTGGYSAPETAQDHARCVELCEHLGLVPELLPSLLLSWSYYIFRGDLAQASAVCTTMARLAGDGGHPLPATALANGTVSFFCGRLDEAHAAMEAFLDDPWGWTSDPPPPGWPLPNDPVAAVSAHLVVTTWLRGDRAAAHALGERTLGRVAELSFPFGPFSAGYVKSQLAIVARLEGDHRRAGRLADEMMALGERHGFVLWTLAGALQGFISQVHLGQREALGSLVATVAQWRELLSAELWTPYWLTELASAQIACGLRADARGALDEALAIAAATGSDLYTAQTLLVRGELRRDAGDGGGTADLHDAVAKAREQGAVELARRASAALSAPATPPLSRP